jgi:hypothetical protein
MHGAGAALCNTAAEFCASQADHVAQHPEKWRIRLNVDLSGCSVDFDRGHRGSPAALKNGFARSAAVDRGRGENAFAPRSIVSVATPHPSDIHFLL